MHLSTYFCITTLELVESSSAQFDYIHCAESAATPMSGFEPWPQDGKLLSSQHSNHSAKLYTLDSSSTLMFELGRI